MRTPKTLAVISGLAAMSQAFGVAGCLTPDESLAARSDVVVVGRIESVQDVSLKPCPESTPQAGRFYERAYPRCGSVLKFVFSAEQVLRGSAPPTLYVLVARVSPLSLACDDRPDPEEMMGLYAILFLEKSGNDYWSVDGPDGIYCGRSPIAAAEVDQARTMLARVPRRKG